MEGKFDKIENILIGLFAEDKAEVQTIKKLIINFSRLPVIQ